MNHSADEAGVLEFCLPDANPDVKLRLAGDYADAGDYARAERLLREILDQLPNHYPARIELGALYLAQDRIDESIAESEAATRINPDLPAAYINLAVACIHKGDFDRAINECEEALFIDPRKADAYKNLCWAYLEKGEYQTAIMVSRKLLELEPGSGLAYNNMAVAYYHKGDYEAAMRHIRQALDLGFPVHPDLFRDLLKRTETVS